MLVFIPTSFTSVLSPGHIVKFVPLNNSRLLLDELPHIVLHDHALHLLCRHGLGAKVDVHIFLSCYLFHPISWQAMEDKSVRRTLLKVQLIKEIILQRIDHPVQALPPIWVLNHHKQTTRCYLLPVHYSSPHLRFPIFYTRHCLHSFHAVKKLFHYFQHVFQLNLNSLCLLDRLS